jgi:quercetin dioxygenase-like cupin family protein
MEVQGKVWGKTTPLFCKNNVEIHRIEGRKGGYCSRHLHVFKYNRFIVESGKLKVGILKDYGSGVLTDETIIGPGEQTTVAPGQLHWFEVLEDCVAFEVYWVELDPYDIERETVGGIH